MTKVILRSVGKDYGNVSAVRDVSLEVNEGQLVALLGPSGCGKTSTLKMIAGLEEITQGELYFGDRLMNHVPAEDRDVAMVFEDYSLYPRMDVASNITFPLRVRGVPQPERDRRLREMLELLELEDVGGANVRQLSGGQQQRVAIARALVREPTVLLFDEPLSHLDAELKVRLRNQIRWLQQRAGVTSVLVTHDQAEALALADKVAVMHLGELHQYGTPYEVYRYPADTFVAGFIGEPPMNFLPCHLEMADDVLTARADGFNVALPESRSKTLGRGLDLERKYVLGIRPEDLYVSYGEDVVCGQGRVFFSEWRGEYQVLLLSQPGAAAHWLTVLIAHDTPFRVGETVSLAVDPKMVHLFDAETERNVVLDPDAETISSVGKPGQAMAIEGGARA